MEESLKFAIPRRFPGYDKVYMVEQDFSREGNAFIDKLTRN
jgi:hypothetical protein